MNIDDAMKSVIKDSDWTAIVTRDGKDFHVIAVWDLVILDANKIGMYAGGMFTTQKNLEKDPYMEILTVSKKQKQGYRIMGNGKMVPKNKLDEKTVTKMQNGQPEFFSISHSALIMTVQKATKLL